MAKGRISDETVRFIFTAEATQLQRESEKSKQKLAELRNVGEELRRQQEQAKATLGKNSDEYRRLTRQVKENEQAIADETRKLDQMQKRLGTNTLTMAELRREARQLQMQLDNTSQALNPEQYAALAGRLSEVTGRMRELREASQSASDGGSLMGRLTKGLDIKGIKTLLAGNALFKIGELIFDNVAEYAGRAFDRIKELISGSIDAARQAEGITRAFHQLDRPDILDQLRQATHGTVADIELMKAALQANDFRLPLDQLGKYLKFAQLKAQQTGQSVDYLTSSIVTGLGRQSLQILDNLGLSAAEVKEEMQRTGDMATAVGNIIDRQLAEAGEHFETAAEREQQATTDVANAQLRLGQQMQQTFGIGSTSFAEMQARAETFILNGLTRLIVYCQTLYQDITTVRVAVEAVKVVFDTFFKLVTAGFYIAIDTVRMLAHTIADTGRLVESLFEAIATRSTDPIKEAWSRMEDNYLRSMNRVTSHLRNTGQQWASNLLDSIDSVMDRRKVKAPQIEQPRPTPAAPAPAAPAPPGSPAPRPAAGTTTAAPDADAYASRLAEREQLLRQQQNALRQMLVEQLISEQDYHQESLDAELKFLADKMNLQQQYGKDATATLGQYQDKVIAEAKRRSQEQAQQEKKAQQERQKQLSESLAAEKTQYEQHYRQIAQQPSKSEADFADMRSATQAAYEQQLISYEQYQQRMTEIALTESQQRQQAEQAAFSASQQLLASTGALFSALQSRETAQVDAKYKRLIAAAKKNGRDTTRLEEQQQAEHMEIQKRYAQKQFRLQVLQIIAATAQSIANVWKVWAATPAIAAALSALAAAQGAVQLATAKAQADQAAGLYEGGFADDYLAQQPPTAAGARLENGSGGFTRRGSDPRRQAGFIPVHQNEFVANHRAVANPAVRPILDVIDRHQRTGDIHLVNTPRLLQEAYGEGRYRGGFTTPDATTAGTPDTDAAAQQRTVALSPDDRQLLQQVARNTARYLTVRSLRDEIAHEERLERNARRTTR